MLLFLFLFLGEIGQIFKSGGLRNKIDTLSNTKNLKKQDIASN